MGFNTGQYRLPSEWDLSQEPADRITADCHDDLAAVLLPQPGLLTLNHLKDNGGVSQQRQLNQGPLGLVVVHSVYIENAGL